MSKARDLANLLADGSIGGAELADGGVSAAKLASTLDLSGKTVTLPTGVGGKVLQAVYNSTGTEVQFGAAGTWTDIGLSAAITPLLSSSRILILAAVQTRVFINSVDNAGALRLLRNASAVFEPTNNYQYGYNNAAVYNTTAEESYVIPVTYLDPHGSTSTLTYKIQAIMRSGAGSNQIAFQDDGAYFSTITLLEIA
jgi:hypothetical protein